MRCIPAIDLREGKAVRLMQGDFGRSTTYGDPLEVAKSAVAAGARQLHLVDLDAARTGERHNQKTVGALIAEVDVPVQVGGGVRNMEAATSVFAAGAAAVIVGTAAIEDPQFLAELSQSFPGRVLVALDYRRHGDPATGRWRFARRGWEESSALDLDDVLGTFSELPLAGLVATDTSRDGTRTGPDVSGLAHLLGITELPIQASGGVAAVSDITALRGLAVAGRSLAGVVLGRAFVEGTLSLTEAVAACEQ